MPHARHHRIQAATLALAATFILTNVKMIVAVYTHSVGVLSEAIHSGLDLLSSLVTFFVVRAAVRPADLDHPFGHGKIESISALFEAFLLFVAGGYIVYEGVSTWAMGNEHQVQHTTLGIATLAFSVLINAVVYFQNRDVGRAHESLAIETNAFHFLTDVFSSLAVLVSLVIVKLTGWVWVDAAVAVLISIYVAAIGIVQIKKCVAELSDTALPEAEIGRVRGLIEKHKDQFLDYHDLRTRKSGAKRYLDFHLEVCSEQRVSKAHEVCDEIESDLMKEFSDVDINIHVEPCGNHGPNCTSWCEFYGKVREEVAKNV